MSDQDIDIDHLPPMDDLLVQEQDGAVLWLMMNRPEKKNALSTQLMASLHHTLCEAEADPSIKVVVLEGEENFSLGADITEIAQLNQKTAKQNHYITQYWDGIAQFSKILIASVNGFALGGGCELALMCDMVVASSAAQFGQPEVKIGLMPGAGGTQRLLHSIGKAQTMDICLTGRRITAFEALNMGFISRVVDEENLYDETKKIADEIAKQPLQSLLAIKAAVLEGLQASGLQAGIAAERAHFYRLLDTYDKQEGIRALLAKQTPVFKDA